MNQKLAALGRGVVADRKENTELLKEWDAWMNRELYGPKWHKHQDELIWAFAFLEKPRSNPHWHLLLGQMRGSTESDEAWAERVEEIKTVGREFWQKLMPGGDIDVRVVERTPHRLIDYVAKEVRHEIQYEDFITPDEFRRS